MPLLSLYYKWGNWYLERLSNLPKIIQLRSGIAKIWTQWMWQSRCLTIILYKPEEIAYQFSIALIQEKKHFAGIIGQHGPVWGSEETRNKDFAYTPPVYWYERERSSAWMSNSQRAKAHFHYSSSQFPFSELEMNPIFSTPFYTKDSQMT